jgi:alanine-synthesizing transaminase
MSELESRHAKQPMFSDRTNWNLAPNRLSEALARYRTRDGLFIDLTASNPTECGFRYDSGAILRALHDTDALAYQPDAKGLLSARTAVSAYYRGHGIEVPSESIFLTTSTSEAYSFIFRLLCNPGDELLIPAPSYPLFEYLSDIQDVKLSPYRLLYDHGWQIDLHAVEKAITPRTRGVIVVHPNNPTGHFVKSTEREALNEICSSRSMALISDEVFLDFPLEAPSASSFANNEATLTFTLSGISKISGLPQMKAAWLIASGPNPQKTQAIERLGIIADTYLSMNAPVQLALPAFLEQRHGLQQQLMERVRHNLAELDRQLAAQKAANRLRVEGGWYAVLRVPATRSDEDFAISLLETKGVYVHPGHFYNFPADGYMVLSLIISTQDFSEGVERLLSTI